MYCGTWKTWHWHLVECYETYPTESLLFLQAPQPGGHCCQRWFEYLLPQAGLSYFTPHKHPQIGDPRCQYQHVHTPDTLTVSAECNRDLKDTHCLTPPLICADWAIRTHRPLWCRLDGKNISSQKHLIRNKRLVIFTTMLANTYWQVGRQWNVPCTGLSGT